MDYILALFTLMLRLSVSSFAGKSTSPKLYRELSVRSTSMISSVTNVGPEGRLRPDVESNKVIVLAGATSVGKSKVAQLLCEEHGNCEVVIADSVQIYKHLDIGSNKPSVAEQEAVPHHLVDICDPHETYSSGEFVRAAVPIVYDILNRGKLPVIVGGSTMYLQWLVQGMPDAPKASEKIERKAEALLKEVENDGRWEDAVEILAKFDTERAYSLGKNDWYRMRRYLEVALSLQEEGSIMQKGCRVGNFPDLDLRCYFLSEDREQLYRMIDYRCEAMLQAGLIDEVASLIQAGHLTPNSTASKAIGYRQTIEYLGRSMLHDSNDSEAQLALFHNYLADFATATRNYAKRQLHWYRKDKAFLWLKIDRSEDSLATSTNEEPYRQVAREILHWNELPDSNFRQTIKRQMLRGAAVAAIRGRMHQKKRLEVHGETEWLAVAALVAKGEMKPPKVVPGDIISLGGEGMLAPSWAAQFPPAGKASAPPSPVGTTKSSTRSSSPSARIQKSAVEEQGGDGEVDEDLEGLLLGDPSPEFTRLGTEELDALREEVNVDDDDDAAEHLAIIKGASDGARTDGLPRTLPEFPADVVFEWTAEDVTIRGAESVKGGKASMKMKRYSRQQHLETTDFDGVIEAALRHTAELKGSYPFLLADFFPASDKDNV